VTGPLVEDEDLLGQAELVVRHGTVPTTVTHRTIEVERA
jgi:hypothetical protein